MENQTPLLKNVKNNVMFFLRIKEMSFTQLAFNVGFTNSGLHRSFTKNTLRLDVLEKIANQLDVEIEQLIDISNKKIKR